MITTPSELELARQSHQHLILRVALPVGAIAYLALAVAHLVVLPPGTGAQMAVISAITGVVLAGAATHTLRTSTPQGAVPISLLMFVLATLNANLHLALTGEPYQTTNLILVAVGASALAVSPMVFGITLLGLFVGFAVSILPHPSETLWTHFGFALALSEALALILFMSQRAAFRRRFEAEQARDRVELERRVQASELLAHEQRYRLMVTTTPVATIVHHGGKIVFANRAAAELTGIGRPEDLVGSRFFDLVQPDDLERAMAWHDGALAELQADSFECRLRSLRRKWPIVHLNASAIRWGGMPAGLVTLADASRDSVEVRRLEKEMPAWKATLLEPVNRATAAMEEGRGTDVAEELLLLSRLLGPTQTSPTN